MLLTIVSYLVGVASGIVATILFARHNKNKIAKAAAFEAALIAKIKAGLV